MSGRTEKPSTSIDEILSAVFALGPATKTDLLTGAVAARADAAVYEILLRLPDGIYYRADEVVPREA